MSAFIKKHLLFIITFSVALRVTAQQDPQFSQYFLNPYLYNPAYGGLDKALSLTAHVRAQWVGIDGNPFSQNVSAQSPVDLLHGGMGLQVINEQAGALRMTSTSLSYNFIQKSRIGYFSFGASGGIIQAAVDGSKLRAPDGDYINTIDHNDPILSSGTMSGVAPDASAGFFFSSSKFNIGLSADHLIPVSIQMTGNSADLNLELSPQYYLQASYMAKLNKTVALRPSLQLKSNGSNLQGEGDLIISFKNFFWIGGGYRGYDQYTQDAVIGLAGININENLLVSYSYDFPMSALQSVSQGSHEVMINYRMNLVKPAKPGKAIFNPRF